MVGASCSQWIACSPMPNGAGGRPLNSLVSLHGASMLKQRGEKQADGKWFTSSAERNKDPILAVLARVLPRRGVVLEIASGTGQHVIHFAKALPSLTWQPSDADADLRKSIGLRIEQEHLANANSPIDLDVAR